MASAAAASLDSIRQRKRRREEFPLTSGFVRGGGGGGASFFFFFSTAKGLALFHAARATPVVSLETKEELTNRKRVSCSVLRVFFVSVIVTVVGFLTKRERDKKTPLFFPLPLFRVFSIQVDKELHVRRKPRKRKKS